MRTCPLVVKYNLEKKIGNVTVDVSTYLNSRSNLKVIDYTYGEYFTTYNRAMGQKGWHPKRVSAFKKTGINLYNFYNFEKASNLLSTIGITILEGTYTSFTAKCTLVDPEYGAGIKAIITGYNEIKGIGYSKHKHQNIYFKD